MAKRGMRGGMRTTAPRTKRAGTPKKTRTRAPKRTPRVAVKRRGKVSARKTPSRSYNQQTGKPTGRAVAAISRRDRLIEMYMAEGLDAQTARERAMADMRSGGRRDWRGG